MKKLFVTIAVSALVLGAARAGVFLPVGPATFKLKAIVPGESFQQIGGKTNQTATSTNITAVFRSTVVQTPFDGADMLTLLANSFRTNFPAGSQIGISLGSLFVVDATGTNIIFDPASVVSFSFDEELSSISETLTTLINPSGTQLSGSVAQTFTCSMTLNYDDTLNATGDTTLTKFGFKGLCIVKVSENRKTGVTKTTTTFEGTGGGPVRGVQTILTGAISSKAAGVLPRD